MTELLLRIMWNSNNWISPSGISEDGGFPGQYGFGMEEWNFQKKDSMNGYIYGYSNYIPARNIQESSLRIGFWALNPETKERLLVGMYEKTNYVSNQDELKKINGHFKKNKIYNRRINELINNASVKKKIAEKEIYGSVSEKILRYKCKTGDIKIFSINDRPVLKKIHDGKKLSMRFSSSTITDRVENFIDNNITSSFSRNPLSEDGYKFISEKKFKTIIRRHNELSNRLSKWLERKGIKNVNQEYNRVDISYEDRAKNDVRMEIKISYSIGSKLGIRESIGQLLEYNYYGNRKPAKKWFIVLDIPPSSDDIDYLKKISKTHKFPVGIGWEKLEKKGDFDFDILNPL